MPESGGRVRVEFVAWATVFVGGDGNSRVAWEEELEPGDTVRSVLRRVCTRHRELDRVLWDRGSEELGEHLEIAVNDAILGIRHSLNSKVKNGDSLLLMGQYMGG